MTSVYHIVTIRVNETSWAHVWRLHFRYLGTGYDSPPELASSIHSVDVLHVPNKFNLCILHVGTCNKTLTLEREKTLAYLDPQMMTMTVIQTEKAKVVKYLVRAMCYYKDKKEMLIVSYNMGSHWVLLTISKGKLDMTRSGL
jgi:hypothetical protein